MEQAETYYLYALEKHIRSVRNGTHAGEVLLLGKGHYAHEME